jgi:signal transduction histidine kinase
LPIEVLDAMYCLAMEAVVNAAFHGHAKRIDIGVEVEPTRICLRVADNGQGFNPESARHGPNGIFEGLELVRQQFAAEGRIESQPSAGARVEVIFPCLADVVSGE